MEQETPNPPAGDPVPPGRLTRLPAPLRWLLLLAASLALALGLEAAGLPAAVLLGAMVAGILFATNGARLSVPRAPFLGAQAIIGCLIADNIDPGIVATFVEDWPLFGAILIIIVLATTIMGYAMARAGVLPGTTAIWGTSAGAASAMVLMAESHGADARLVAFMQYSRVVAVASAAALVAALVVDAEPSAGAVAPLFPAVDWAALAATLGVAFASCAIGVLARVPSGALLAPMIAAAALQAGGQLAIELPPWLVMAAFALVGWRIGLGFTRRSLRHAASALPYVLGSIGLLMALCAGLAVLLAAGFDIDLLTAYLATSPGGLDTVAIIAASTPVDVSFVMALQTGRLVLIVVLGPLISQLTSRRLPPRS